MERLSEHLFGGSSGASSKRMLAGRDWNKRSDRKLTGGKSLPLARYILGGAFDQKV